MRFCGKLLAVMLATLMIISSCGGVISFAASSGTLGENGEWSYDSATKTLTISASGALQDYSSYSSVPWRSCYSSATTVVINEGVENVPAYSFYQFSYLASVSLPSTLKSIGTKAFYNCKKMASYTLPSSIEVIGESAFENNTKLTSIVMPESLVEIQTSAFKTCTLLESVVLNSSLKKIGASAFQGCTVLSAITPSETLEEIGGSAFEGCSALKNFPGESDVKVIGDSAFRQCSALESADLSAVTSIGTYAFSECVALKDINKLGNVSVIPDYCFYKCSKLNAVSVPDGVTKVGTFAFYHCDGITELVIPDSVTTIGKQAISNMTSLTDLSMPISLSYSDSTLKSVKRLTLSAGTGEGVDYTSTSIRSSYIYSCKDSIEAVEIEDGIQSIGSYTLSGLGVNQVFIPFSVQTIGEGAIPSTISVKSYHTSEAENYASENGNAFIPAHNEEVVKTCSIKSSSAATCSQVGAVVYGCDYCDYEYTIESTGNHITYVSVEQKSPTCSENGYTVEIKCSVCNTVVTASQLIEKLPHDLISHGAKLETCTSDGYKAYETCKNCDYTTFEEVKATGHAPVTAVKENEVSATCKSSGSYDSVIYCSVCGENLSSTSVSTEKLSHDLVSHEAKSATCTSDGYNAYHTCKNCDYTTFEEVKAIGHTPATAVNENEVPATCKSSGSYDSVVYCSTCGEKLSSTFVTTEKLPHDLVSHEAQSATCTLDGYKAYVTCKNCDYTTFEEVKATGHAPATAVKENEVPATCKSSGCYDSVVYCSVCGEKLSSTSVVIEKLSHDLISHEAKSATCTVDGYKAYETCKNCDYTTFEEEKATGHTSATAVKENEVPATCKSSGSYDSVVYCSVCGENLSSTSVTTEKLPHGLVSHEAKSATCTADGYKAYVTCKSCDYTTFEEVKATGHTPATAVNENEVLATCKSSGSYDSVVYCSVCGKKLSSTSVSTEKLSHDLVLHEAKSATCTSNGYKAYETCKNCYYTTFEEVKATGHSPTTAVKENEVPATCQNAGSYDSVVYCSTCGEKLSNTSVTTEKLPHDLISHEAKSATCTSDGYKAYVTCKNCDYTTFEEVKATGHTPAIAVKENEVPATCKSSGLYDSVVYCSVCGEKLSSTSVVIEKLPHDLVSYEAKSATCTSDGYKAYETCKNCDYTTYSEIKAVGHVDKNNDGYCDSCNKLLVEKENNCSHICHKTGIYKFFFAIARFFWKIFKIKQYCSCGVAHY